MVIYRLKQQTLLKGLLATVILLAGIAIGFRSKAPDVDTPQLDTSPINISGEWIGMTSEDYGAEARSDYRIVFVQNGDDIEGVLYMLRNHARAIYTETSLSGTIDRDTVFYQSDEILVIENAYRHELCLVETTVVYDVINGQETLTGTWIAQENEPPACDTISGQVILTRQS